MDNKENATTEISLIMLLQVLKKSVVWVLLGAVLFGCAAALFGMFAIEDQYSSSITYMIGDGATTTNSDLSAMSNHLERYKVILTSNKVIKEVVMNSIIDDGDIDFAVAQMSAATDFSGTSAGVFEITVTYSDPSVSYAMITSYRNLIDKIVEDNDLPFPVTLVDAPNAPAKAPSNNGRTLKYGAIGFVLGALIVYGISLLIAINDSKIHDEQEIKDVLNLPVLGSIPRFSAVTSANNAVKPDNKNMR